MPKKFYHKLWQQKYQKFKKSRRLRPTKMRLCKPHSPQVKPRVRYFATAAGILALNLLIPLGVQQTSAASCPELKIIFARGSGGERWEDQNYLAFRDNLQEKLAGTSIKYEFEDLDYPAIGIGKISTLLTTFVSGGEGYEFGKSVNEGMSNLVREINSSACPNTRYVIGGYSQGAIVVSRTLRFLNPDKMIYAATFGDPKIYLPEGAGAVPAACKGANLSNYRIYVPDCQAYIGLLGGYIPYQPEGFVDKLGTWCHNSDIFCSSHLNIVDHISYVSDGIYAEASKTIFDKITRAFGIKNDYVAVHDTAILIDSTGSMETLIEKYKAEALKLAQETLASGGRVALYDYRDINDPYEPVEHCNFETCTLESFSQGLNEIETDGGGDNPESLLSAGLKVMKKLNWKYGATKSLVVLTDDTYHSPDIDGTEFDEVVALSKKIDPVNFYIITTEEFAEDYQALASATDGMVATSADEVLYMMNHIMERYDSLPRVETTLFNDEVAPEISSYSVVRLDESRVEISWNGNQSRTLIALNDAILGVSEGDSIILTDLDFNIENIVTLVPLGEDVRGDGVTISLNSVPTLPKAPNTGQR